MQRDDEWLQVSCSLFPGLDRRPHFPWEPLAEAISTWRDQGLFQRFWFVRKPPALRLRFQGPAIRERFQAALSLWLTEAERNNDIRGFRFTVYEPEIHRFGGHAGMDVAHSVFDAGTRLALKHAAMVRGGAEPVSAIEISFAAANDLLQRCLDDREELWDVWSRLALLVSSTATPNNEKVQVRLTRTLNGFSEFRGSPHSPWADTLLTIEDAHARAAAMVRALSDAGALTVGIREWLSAVVVFDWNRFGLPDNLDELACALRLLVRMLAPERNSGAAVIAPNSERL